MTFDPKTEKVKDFVKRFAEFGETDPHWDRFLSFLFKHGSDKKQILEAIAYGQIVATPGGSQALEDNFIFNEPDNSSTFLMAALDPRQRERILSTRPALRENGHLVIKLDVQEQRAGVKGGVDLVLTKYCFSDADTSSIGRITQTEKIGAKWKEKNAAGEYVFLRELLDMAPKQARHDSRTHS